MPFQGFWLIFCISVVSPGWSFLTGPGYLKTLVAIGCGDKRRMTLSKQSFGAPQPKGVMGWGLPSAMEMDSVARQSGPFYETTVSLPQNYYLFGPRNLIRALSTQSGESGRKLYPANYFLAAEGQHTPSDFYERPCSRTQARKSKESIGVGRGLPSSTDCPASFLFDLKKQDFPGLDRPISTFSHCTVRGKSSLV